MSEINNKLHSALEAWGNDLKKISEKCHGVPLKSKGIPQEVKDFVSKHYNIDGEEFNSIFKPTLTNFILSVEGAQQYFVFFAVIGNIRYIQWNEVKTKMVNDLILAGGTYTFFTSQGMTTADYSFVFKKVGNDYKILLHHSSLPA